MSLSRVGCCFLATFILSIIGCGKNTSETNKIGSLKGKVTLKGQAITGGTLFFVPRGGQGRMETAIGFDGSYEMNGLPVGEVDVGVDTESVKRELEEYSKYGGQMNIPQMPTVDKSKLNDKSGGSPEERAKMEKMMAGMQGKQPDIAKKKYVPVPEKYRDPKTSGVVVKAEPGVVKEQDIVFP